MTHTPAGFEIPRVFIGYDPRERVAVNVLADSFQARSSLPLLIGQVRLDQLAGVYKRERDPRQSTDFSFSRFLVPWLAGYRGWALFIDADMLCLADLAELWALRDERYAVQLVKHQHVCEQGLKFQGMPQTPYGRKNWSSVMLFNCARCTVLTPELVNSASGLELHQFHWLADEQIGALPPEWNVLVGVQPLPAAPKILHYTLGGPWFDDCLTMPASDRWLAARAAMNEPLPVEPLAVVASTPVGSSRQEPLAVGLPEPLADVVPEQACGHSPQPAAVGAHEAQPAGHRPLPVSIT